jgi:hypothetical protein
MRDELAGLFGEVDQDRARLDHRVRLPAWSVAVDNRGHLQQWIDFGKFGRELLARPHVNGLDIVGQPAFLEHDEDLLHVRAGQRIKVNHENCLSFCGRGLRRPSYRASQVTCLAPH